MVYNCFMMNNDLNFFFYDLETSGLKAKEDRIMQFAGQRTDLELNLIGEPVNVLVKLASDTLPGPSAIMVTGITPQSTQEGMSEAEFCRFLDTEIFTPGTIVTGYNSVRFDDEFMRYLWWRNFYDPYEWQWRDQRSRWDLLDVVRMVRALRPDGIKWPVLPGGKAVNRLELITKMNGIEHTHAHDALSDVEALISVTKLLKERQPKMFEYLLGVRDKKKIAELVNLDLKRPFVYTSGVYDAEWNKTTVAFPLTVGKNNNSILVFDLRYNLDKLLEEKQKKEAEQAEKARLEAEKQPTLVQTGLEGLYTQEDEKQEDLSDKTKKKKFSFFPIVKELSLNKCPAVAPLGVLEAENGWTKIGLNKETVQKNLDSLLAHPEFAEQMRTELEKDQDWPEPEEVEAALYDGFLGENDKIKCAAVRAADANKLADFDPGFNDERLPELLMHYKARNFAESLSQDEAKAWEEYRKARLQRQLSNFNNQLSQIKREAEEKKANFGGETDGEILIRKLEEWRDQLMAD